MLPLCRRLGSPALRRRPHANRAPPYRLGGTSPLGEGSGNPARRPPSQDGNSGLGELSGHYTERFIPFERQVLLSVLQKELSSVPETERDSLPSLLVQAEADTMRHYYSILERLRTLYEPINPDRDTLPEISLDGPVQLEQEKVLLRELAPLFDQANFNALSEQVVQYAFRHHDPLFKSQVDARIENYEYVKFWALGLRPGAPPREMQRSLESSRWWPFSGSVQAPMHRRYCKRVVMAARVKGGRLVLKSFKDIPLENLESLLPAVRVHLPLRDRTLLYASLLVGGTALFANLAVLGLHSLRVDFALVLGLFAVLMGYRRHRLFEQRREQHALEHAVTLYTKSTSNNGETILALVQRAQQEHVKEILLAHSFGLLLHHHQQHRRGEQAPPRDDVETAEMLSCRVSDWLQDLSGLPVHFNGARALAHLRALQAGRSKGR